MIAVQECAKVRSWTIWQREAVGRGERLVETEHVVAVLPDVVALDVPVPGIPPGGQIQPCAGLEGDQAVGGHNGYPIDDDAGSADEAVVFVVHEDGGQAGGFLASRTRSRSLVRRNDRAWSASQRSHAAPPIRTYASWNPSK